MAAEALDESPFYAKPPFGDLEKSRASEFSKVATARTDCHPGLMWALCEFHPDNQQLVESASLCLRDSVPQVGSREQGVRGSRVKEYAGGETCGGGGGSRSGLGVRPQGGPVTAGAAEQAGPFSTVPRQALARCPARIQQTGSDGGCPVRGVG